MKQKVSITIDKDLLEQIEEIAKKQGTNRSKYIERIMRSQTQQVPVLILAGYANLGGKPKSLKPYQQKKLIDHQLQYLRNQGLSEIVVSTNSKELKSYLQKNYPEITVWIETEKKGSAGTIKRAKELFGKRFIFMYCDILLELDVYRLISFHLRNKSDTTLVLKSKKNVSKYGVAILEGSSITRFEEKPEKSDSHLIYIGAGIIETGAAEKLKTGKFELQLDALENKHGYIYEGFWKSFEEESDFK